jgi:uncharacterized protein
MTYVEEVASMAYEQAGLIGILARPVRPERMGVVVLVGGPQYRAGSHRQFVLLSRALAHAGYAVLRFDFRGMGDSEGAACNFLNTRADIAVAIHTLQQAVPEVAEVALWGLCDGASAALLYWHDTHDARVGTLCLVNPWVRSEASLAHTHIKHYYLQRLLQPDFWRKLLQGGIGSTALGGLARTLRTALQGKAAPAAQATFQQRMARAWLQFPGHIFLLLSEDDFTAKEFLHHAQHDSAWSNSLGRPRLLRHNQPHADHTFSSAALQAALAERTLRHGLQHLPP